MDQFDIFDYFHSINDLWDNESIEVETEPLEVILFNQII
jgi:hypothetical protein